MEHGKHKGGMKGKGPMPSKKMPGQDMMKDMKKMPHMMSGMPKH